MPFIAVVEYLCTLFQIKKTQVEPFIRAEERRKEHTKRGLSSKDTANKKARTWIQTTAPSLFLYQIFVLQMIAEAVTNFSQLLLNLILVLLIKSNSSLMLTLNF